MRTGMRGRITHTRRDGFVAPWVVAPVTELGRGTPAPSALALRAFAPMTTTPRRTEARVLTRLMTVDRTGV
jgi:hypothetical protein